MSISDTDILPGDAPLPVRARTTKPGKAPEAPSEKPAAEKPPGFPLHVYVGTDTPVVLDFPSKEIRDKSCAALSQRVNRLPTTITCGGKTYTFLYITHFICAE
jgi:hypothetical protein